MGNQIENVRKYCISIVYLLRIYCCRIFFQFSVISQKHLEGLNGSDDLQKYLTFRRTYDILQNMEKDKTITHDELRPEYDLRKLRVRKFGPARKQFGNFVKLEPDVAAVFPDDVTVNKALRCLIQDSKANRKTHSYRLPMKTSDSRSKQLDNSIVKLEPDVAEAFSDPASVNEALRFLIRVTKENSAIPPTKS